MLTDMLPPSAVRQIKVCLNGGRARADHPAVPLTPAELAMSARAAVEAGAEAIHVHPRADDGTESLLATDVAAAVAAIRRSCPAVPVGVSTGLWITSGDVWRREAQAAGWVDLSPSQRPDFASVNLSEPGFARLVPLLESGGIGAEAGVWSIADARTLATEGSALNWLRVLVEIRDAGAEACVEDAELVLAALRADRIDLPVLLHGEGEACWPLIEQAGLLDLPTRIGLEDVLTGPSGDPVHDNAHLVTIALHAWRTAGWT